MGKIEVSVVMPCLNEEATIGICIRKAFKAIKDNGLKGEVVVSDNGSSDRSVEIAESLGARVVHQPLKGYGNAFRKGIDEARGKYIVMADSDDTYPIQELARFAGPLMENRAEFVTGTRLKGKILPGAMPALHRYIGNPALTWVANLLFHIGISDINCGMRSFTKEAYEKMRAEATGMEFTPEMAIKASINKLRIMEIPIDYYPRATPSKLNSFSDGWRDLKYILTFRK